jgi:poly(3-hydroxybutyrate) depolymerase
MHGGGGAPKRVNDRQWENQKRLYEPKSAVYVAPRAPTDNWNLWHEPHIDRLFARLIENMAALEGVDPNRVYLMGYSAGGDGVYQLAPRMADRLAAAAMMAGHPNEASPLGLRNLPFAIFCGGRDAAYQRNEVAREWGTKLDELRAADPEGYEHTLTIYPDKGHWMDGEDASSLDWMATFTRKPAPKKVVWMQDDVTHEQFYWLAVPEGAAKVGAEVIAEIDGQTVRLIKCDADALRVRLDDRLVNLDEPVRFEWAGGEASETARLSRTIAALARTLEERGDPELAFAAEWTWERSPAER